MAWYFLIPIGWSALTSGMSAASFSYTPDPEAMQKVFLRVFAVHLISYGLLGSIVLTAFGAVEPALMWAVVSFILYIFPAGGAALGLRMGGPLGAAVGGAFPWVFPYFAFLPR